MSFSVEIELEYDEILKNSNKYDRQILLKHLLKRMDKDSILKIFKELNDDQIQNEYRSFISGGNGTFLENIFHTNLIHIGRRYISLDVADIETIENIAKKY